MSNLERAIAIAAEAHSGQKDKAGQPYILHPLRVMLNCRTDSERVVAVLHDVVEDTPWTLDGLRAEGFAEEIIDGVAAVTRAEDEDYFAYVRRAAAHPLGRAVKRADLADNLDPSRLPSPTIQDRERVERYRQALEAVDHVEA
ncbi:MAG: HD domain-containing protein [Longimicrobiales bacterium]